MKPVDFGYERPRTLAETAVLLGGNDNAKVMAGGQTLGPMLNLRLAQPDLVVDISRIPELSRIEETADAVTLGACITHAAIEDGRAPEPARGMLAHVAGSIAYRAVRTRGTIGGSLAHADPAADWLTCLGALEATVSLTGPSGSREVPIATFVHGVMATDLAPDEIIDGVRVRRLTASGRWGYHKICRKTGEFAEAIGAIVIDRDRATIVAGATSGRPVVLSMAASQVAPLGVDAATLTARLQAAGLAGDTYETRIHVAAVRRAITEALAR